MGELLLFIFQTPFVSTKIMALYAGGEIESYNNLGWKRP